MRKPNFVIKVQLLEGEFKNNKEILDKHHDQILLSSVTNEDDLTFLLENYKFDDLHSVDKKFFKEPKIIVTQKLKMLNFDEVMIRSESDAEMLKLYDENAFERSSDKTKSWIFMRSPNLDYLHFRLRRGLKIHPEDFDKIEDPELYDLQSEVQNVPLIRKFLGKSKIADDLFVKYLEESEDIDQEDLKLIHLYIDRVSEKCYPKLLKNVNVVKHFFTEEIWGTNLEIRISQDIIKNYRLFGTCEKIGDTFKYENMTVIFTKKTISIYNNSRDLKDVYIY